MDFVVIDFETANQYRTSACSLGIVCIKDNQVAFSKSWLIRPEPFFFNAINIQIHGITKHAVQDAPTFAEIWPELRPLIENQLIVAHNASFDISVLRKSLEHYGITCPDFQILCTYRLAQNAFPNLAYYRLDIISSLLDIPLTHHEALSDAHACAAILCELLRRAEIDSLTELEKYYNIHAGYHRANDRHCDYAPCSHLSHSSPSPSQQSYKELSTQFRDVEITHFTEAFANKYFVFTGTLSSISHQWAMKIVARSGGIPQDKITSKTNYLVVGIQYSPRVKDGVSAKERLAAERKQRGQDIEIIREDHFLSMVDEELLPIRLSSEEWLN